MVMRSGTAVFLNSEMLNCLGTCVIMGILRIEVPGGCRRQRVLPVCVPWWQMQVRLGMCCIVFGIRNGTRLSPGNARRVRRGEGRRLREESRGWQPGGFVLINLLRVKKLRVHRFCVGIH
ncbi:hypothetical protein NDU88_005952 [Pleurodeles waltl]|uniref:Uncharacterized protein n=1 Tax=Pleurodeles waltl TaxID=8319 RepID=A0AAV7QH94_PLEWA|nr:hypothetical protein NDU88_005952 [Pleurodeles waltl]